MTTYSLYLESGPKRRTTMVHVLDLLGCIANGATTEVSLQATPAAIGAYRRFLQRHGERVASGSFDTRVVEHVTEGQWLGNGSPYIVFGPDHEPLSAAEVTRFARRFEALSGELARWAEGQSARQLAAAPRVGGRTSRAILLHVLGTPGAYLSSALGGAPGFSRLAGAAERGELPLLQAYAEVTALFTARLGETTPAQRAATRSLSQGTRVYTLRKAVRRALEHTWEHLAELSRRPGGPALR